VDLNIWRIEVSARQTSPPRRTRLIASSGLDVKPEFSPDGSKIAFYSNRSGATEIWVCDRDGSNAVQVTSFGGPLTGTPRWSPDGQQIIFDSRPEGHADIFVVGASGGKPRRLTTNPAQDMMPCWSRDGKWIYFYSNRTGRYEIWKMLAVGTSAPEESIQMTRNYGQAPYESPDGKLVYYYKSFGVWQVPAEGGKETQVLESVRGFISFALADKGIFFIPRDEAVVRFFDFNTRAIRTVATLEKPVGDLAVSRDGRTILYSQMDNVGSDLMLVENFR
jgi:Tol biopolymer transport system component